MTHTTAQAKLSAFLPGALAVSALLVLGGASLHADNPDHVKQLLSTRSCVGCDLQNAQLPTANLNRADLTGADLSGAFLYRASFRGATLKDAKFGGADLKGANLTGALDANLAGAITNESTTCPNGRPGPCS